MGARAWPYGCLCPGPERFGLRNSLRSDSPRLHIEFRTGAQPRPQALPPLTPLLSRRGRGKNSGMRGRHG